MTVADPRLPNLFIIGAPKSGTTFLHHALSLVPTVFMSSVKEPGYFTSIRDQRRGLDFYLHAYFHKSEGYSIRGESTPWYLYSERAREQIAALPGPAPKLVVMVRRPSERALSMYRDQVRLNREPRDFGDAVGDELVAIESGQLDPDVRKRYVWGGLYADHVVRWRDDFGPTSLHVMVVEEFSADPDRAWSELAEFLDHDLGPSRLDEVEEIDRNRSGVLRWPRADAFLRSLEGRENPVVEAARRVLPAGMHRRVLQRFGRLNRTATDEPPAEIDRATLDRLDTFYRPEVHRLEMLIGRSIPSWVSPPAHADDAARKSRRSGTIGSATTGEILDERPLHIVHLVARSHRRGAELVAVELADELNRRGHHNRVIALGPATGGGHESGMTPMVGSPGVGIGDLVTRVRRVRRLLAAERFDVVLAHGGWAAQIAALASIGRRRRPLLVWQRILGFPDSVWTAGRHQWWRMITGRFDACVALTAELQMELRRLGFAGPVWVIPNSRRPDRFLDLDRTMARASLRAELAVDDDVDVIGFVGHLVSQKRPERAIDVLERVLERGRKAHLAIAGDGQLRSALEVDVRNRGLERSVTFLGHRDDVEAVFGGVELSLLTSDAEGIPGVAIESILAGCPMVATPVGGVCEVIQDGVTGVVVDRRDSDLLADAVVALLDDNETRAAMSDAGRLQTDRFSAEATARTYADRLGVALESR